MFLEFTRIDPSHPTRTSQVIVNSPEILLISSDDIRDLDTQAQYSATRIDVVGHPVYSFFTLATINHLSQIIPIIDVTGGAGTGGSCLDPSSLDIVYPQVVYPHIRLLVVHNSSMSETEELVINPNYIVWAQSTIFTDRRTGLQVSALLISLKDTPPRAVISTLLFQDLETLLTPTAV